jgi:hypothetical protein
LAAWIARAAALAMLQESARKLALPAEARQAAREGAAAEAHIVAEHTAAAADIAAVAAAAEGVAVDDAAAGIAGPHTAAEAAEASAVVAKRPAPAEGRRIPAEVVATEPTVRERIARAAEAPRPQKLLLPALVRRRKGSLSSRGEHRVRIADISS